MKKINWTFVISFLVSLLLYVIPGFIFKIDQEYYNNLKLEANTVFVYNASTSSFDYLDTSSMNDKVTFYKNAVDNAINKVLIKDEVISKTTNEIMKNNMMSLIMSFIISMTIFFLVIPLISKNGSTLGKYMFKIIKSKSS